MPTTLQPMFPFLEPIDQPLIPQTNLWNMAIFRVLINVRQVLVNDICDSAVIND